MDVIKCMPWSARRLKPYLNLITFHCDLIENLYSKAASREASKSHTIFTIDRLFMFKSRPYSSPCRFKYSATSAAA